MERIVATGLLVALGTVGTVNATANVSDLINNPVNTFLQFGAFGVLCMLVLHVFRHTIPRLAATYETNSREQRISNDKQMIQTREDFKETLDKQRKDFVEEMRLERGTDDRRTETLSKNIQDLTKQVQKLVEYRAPNL